MVEVRYLAPLCQPTGRTRMLGELEDGLQDARFAHMRIVVAYAKVGPLLRLEEAITAALARGLTIDAVFGIDQQGTSRQALAFALARFRKIYVTRERGITFHPKIYAFRGSGAARVFVGSNNLTVGGTETNFESAIRLDLELPSDAATLELFSAGWDELMPAGCPATTLLTPALLASLVSNGIVLDERSMQGKGGGGTGVPPAARSGLPVRPPSALPKSKASAASSPAAPTPAALAASQCLAIQIKPHHNGEIFLSVTAALQNPSFFKWPFAGRAISKKTGKAAYPQLTPDPRINVTVYGKPATPVLTLQDYALNTVFYEAKKEIRITASPLVGVVPDYSIMIMKISPTAGLDYEMIIHTPESADYEDWLSVCNQTMPGGGKAPRKFGWF